MGKKRKRSASRATEQGDRRKPRAATLLETDERKPEEGAMGTMVKSGSAVESALPGKASRASRASFSEAAEGVHEEDRGRYVRRAGLSDMGPVTGSYVSSGRDEAWATGFALGGRKKVVKGPVDAHGYRISRFTEHL